MSIQQNILQRYRLLFPKETLKETSARTGIQITRVFRLFNGKTMKVGELEAFEGVINQKLAENPSYQRLTNLAEKAGSILTNDELKQLADKIERKIAVRTFSRMYINSTQTDAIIA